MIAEILASIFLLMGSGFMALAALGVLRMPDLFMRMHASTKAGTLGVGLILLALAIYFRDTQVTTRSLATIIFFISTAPIAAHMIGRAGYIVRVKTWKGTLLDELKDWRP